MKQLSAKLKSRGATAVVLTLALGAAVYLNWSFSREAPPSLVVSDTAGEAVETSAQAAEPITDPLVLETSAGADTQMMSADETANKNYGEAQLVSVNKDSGTEFFESARLTRSKARDEALDTLKKSLKDTKLTSEEKEQLTTQLSDRISNITLETKLETLIKSNHLVLKPTQLKMPLLKRLYSAMLSTASVILRLIRRKSRAPSTISVSDILLMIW